MATTGAAWHIPNPDNPKPWAWFDPNATLKFPVDWSDWLADKETDYSSHEVFAHEALTIVESTEVDGVIVVTVRAAGSSPGLVADNYYGFTVRITTVDGQTEDQTLRLRITEK
jgi:hypothetical protein